MGALVKLRDGEHLPASVRGTTLHGLRWLTPVPSAQLKSAVLLAGLLARGKTSVSEPALSRDHTERLLPLFGAKVKRQGLCLTVKGEARLRAVRWSLPGDASCAAFWVVASCLVPGSRLRLPGVGANPTRNGFLRVLARMGARVERSRPAGSPEPVADLVVHAGPLRAADIQPDEIPALIDEIPILAIAASQAAGTSRFRGLAELRHKESDRLAATVRLLRELGAKAWTQGDDLVIRGPAPLRGASFDPKGDHRLAMAAAVAGLIARGRTRITGPECIAVSYPGFAEELVHLASC
jgi:3-phosphoshikimate 1-carboxyvinyltransferase